MILGGFGLFYVVRGKCKYLRQCGGCVVTCIMGINYRYDLVLTVCLWGNLVDVVSFGTFDCVLRHCRLVHTSAAVEFLFWFWVAISGKEDGYSM